MKKVVAAVMSALFGLVAVANAQGVPDDLVGSCQAPPGQAMLDANGVVARVLNNGHLFYPATSGSDWDKGVTYTVPRFGGARAIFAASFIVDGLIDGKTRVAGSTYSRAEFWPGPLDDNGAPPADCERFNRLYKVWREDIEAFEESGIATGDLVEWPTGLGAPTLDASGKRLDVGDLSYAERLKRVIELDAGERPEMPGDVALWWISNDRGNEHIATRTLPLGIELHGFAYAHMSGLEALNNATFYRFTIVNRNSKPIEDGYFGVFAAPELGDAGDNFVGADTLRRMAFVYNSDNQDDGPWGYGTSPPALGFRVLRGPLADEDGIDNDRDGLIDEPGERPGMSHLLELDEAGVNGPPGTGEDYHNFLRGRLKNGNPILFGGDGFQNGTTNTPANYMYPGDPVTGEYWSEVNTGSGESPGGSREIIFSSGPFHLSPGESKSVDLAVVYGRGADHLNSITELRRASDALQEAFEDGFQNYARIEPESGAVSFLSPGSFAPNQPVSLQLAWDSERSYPEYQIEFVTRDEHRDIIVEEPSLQMERLKPGRLYRWRVKGVGPWGQSRFSEWGSFVTTTDLRTEYPLRASTVRNASGDLNPPDQALYIRYTDDGPGLPCPEDPDQLCFSPTKYYQQSTSEFRWVIHTGPGARTYDEFVAQLSANRTLFAGLAATDYELRWVGYGQGGQGYDPKTGSAVDVGFELWNVGNASTGDASDDFRMIPLVDMTRGGDPDASGTTLSFGGDHPGVGGSRNPYSNLIDWYDPSDRSPGAVGYNKFVSTGNGLGRKIFQDMTLVQIGANWDPPLTSATPEIGTVFRIRFEGLPRVALAGPQNEARFSPGPVRFSWNGDGTAFRFQLSKSPTFSTTVLDVDNATSGLVVDVDPRSGYLWRIESDITGWSETWSFVTLDAPGEASDDPIATPTLYPNPASSGSTLQFFVRNPGFVRVVLSDALGREVRRLLDQYVDVGPMSVPIDSRKLAAGTYFYTIRTGDFAVTKSMAVVR